MDSTLMMSELSNLEQEYKKVCEEIKNLRQSLQQAIKKERELAHQLNKQNGLMETVQNELSEMMEDVKTTHSYRIAADQVNKVTQMMDPGIQIIKRGVDVIGSNQVGRTVIDTVSSTVDKVKNIIPIHQETKKKEEE